jgi:hypothetical protein
LKVVDLAQSAAMVGYFDLLVSNNKNAISNSQQLISLNEKKKLENKGIEELTQLQIKNMEHYILELKGSHGSFIAKYDLNKEVCIDLLQKEYEKAKSMVINPTFIHMQSQHYFNKS